MELNPFWKRGDFLAPKIQKNLIKFIKKNKNSTEDIIMEKKVTVIGGGNGAFATAADLTIRGNQVTLFELPRFAAGLSEVIEKGGIEMEAYANNGLTGGFAKLHKITTDIGEALAESDIVFIVVPTYSMDTIASLCAPHLRDGQIIVLTPANFGGALYFHNVMRSAGCTAKVTLVELSCMIYACRKKTPSSVWVRGYKHNMGTACFPSCDTDVVMPRLKTLYPHLKEYHNVLETGLSNINTTMHTSIMLLNAACIDNEEDRLFYRECCTKSLDNLMDALDAERRNLNVLGDTDIPHLTDIIRDWYAHQGAEGNTISELQHSLPHFGYSPMPKTMDYRYITEDVPFGLIPSVEFFKQFGFEYTVHKALVDVICAVCKRDFYKEARTMEQLGIAGMDREQLIRYLETGK